MIVDFTLVDGTVVHVPLPPDVQGGPIGNIVYHGFMFGVIRDHSANDADEPLIVDSEKAS